MATVRSKDGTRIAYEVTGSGPPLILIDGALGFRQFGSASRLAQLLASELTVFCYDRRGRGESGDNAPYAVDREIEDIDALIDAGGGAARLFGMSSGGALALEATAKLELRVEKLAVYEIPYDSTEDAAKGWREYRAQLKDLLAADRRGDAVALFMALVGTPAAMIEGMRGEPMWKTFTSVAPTLAYDAAVLGEDRSVPTDIAARVTAPTLIMDGGASVEFMPFMRATAVALTNLIPNAKHVTLGGQRHDVDVAVLAPELTAFLGRGGDGQPASVSADIENAWR